MFVGVTVLAVSAIASSTNQTFSDFTTALPVKWGEALVIGFVGGWERWDNPKRGVRKLALRLRARNLPGVYVETVENHKRYLAIELVRRALDWDGSGRLDARERAAARIVLYGQSFGGAAVLKAARELEMLEVPILLTVQVDSIGRDDALVPANVAAAANLFQRDFWPIRGEPRIRAADAARTRMLGNFQYHYRGKKVDLSEETWVRRFFAGAHTKMEFDPEVWKQVEGLILEVLR